VEIPELPGTPVGTPVASTPPPAPASTVSTSTPANSNSSPALSAPAPALSTPRPADSTPAPAISSSSSVSTQVTDAGSGDTQSGSIKVAQKHGPAATAETKSGERIRVGEMLHIVISDTPTPIPPIDDKVKEDGTITLPYNQTFHVADKTPAELQQEIRKRYVPDYFQQLTATVLRDVMRAYYVDGEVRNPSKQVYTGMTKLTEAIASVGGFTDFANRRKVKLIRANGKVEIYDCKKLLEHPELDPEVFPGDKIVVPRSPF
jgi:polysaccharide export outer membrane protein